MLIQQKICRLLRNLRFFNIRFTLTFSETYDYRLQKFFPQVATPHFYLQNMPILIFAHTLLRQLDSLFSAGFIPHLFNFCAVSPAPSRPAATERQRGESVWCGVSIIFPHQLSLKFSPKSLTALTLHHLPIGAGWQSGTYFLL